MLTYSLGELIDKITIENIKIATLREQLHGETNPEKKIELNDKMMHLNQNRSILSKAINDKINDVFSGKDNNETLKNIRTYAVKTNN